MKVALLGVVNWLLGSDSQVIAPLNFLMYLYSMEVLAGRFTVTKKKNVNEKFLRPENNKTY